MFFLSLLKPKFSHDHLFCLYKSNTQSQVHNPIRNHVQMKILYILAFSRVYYPTYESLPNIRCPHIISVYLKKRDLQDHLLTVKIKQAFKHNSNGNKIYGHQPAERPTRPPKRGCPSVPLSYGRDGFEDWSSKDPKECHPHVIQKRKQTWIQDDETGKVPSVRTKTVFLF